MDDADSERSKNELNKPLDKESERLKIQVRSDYNLAISNLRTGILASSFVGLLLVLVTLDFQKTISLLAYYLALLFVFLFFGGFFYRESRKYQNDLESTYQLIEDVDRGKAVPPLEEIRGTKKQSLSSSDSNSEPDTSKPNESNEKLSTRIHFAIIQASAVIVVLIPSLSSQLPETVRFALLSAIYPFIAAALTSTLRLFWLLRGRKSRVESDYSMMIFTLGWLSLATTLALFAVGEGLLASFYLWIGVIGGIISVILFFLDVLDVPLGRIRRK